MANERTQLGLLTSLKRTLLKKRLVLFVAGSLVTVAVVLAVAVVLSVAANLAVLPVAVKVPLLVLVLAATLVYFSMFSLGRLLTGSTDGIAVDLENTYPALKGRLIAAVQFARMKSTPGYSRQLMDITRDQAVESAAGLDFDRIVSLRPVWKAVRLLAPVAILAAALLLVAPGFFGHSWRVYSNPTTVVAPPLGYRVATFPGSVEWVKYRDIDIGGVVFGDNIPDRAEMYHRFAGGNWQQTDFDLSDQKSFRLTGSDSAAFSLTLRQVGRSFDYYVRAGRVTTEVQHVEVVDRPRVTGITLSLFYPEYTGLSPVVIDENNGSVSAVVGTRVNMKLTANLPVETAELVVGDSSRRALTVDGRRMAASVTIDKSYSYHIELRDHLGEKNPDPIEYYVTAIPDEYPSVDVVRPGFDVNLGDDMVLPLKVHIFDDYGFSSLVLKYTV
ncbi:MAG: hypothetical protein JSW34_09450, partial [Candidatus Zixiibacteriota bacterium]